MKKKVSLIVCTLLLFTSAFLSTQQEVNAKTTTAKSYMMDKDLVYMYKTTYKKTKYVASHKTYSLYEYAPKTKLWKMNGGASPYVSDFKEIYSTKGLYHEDFYSPYGKRLALPKIIKKNATWSNPTLIIGDTKIKTSYKITSLKGKGGKYKISSVAGNKVGKYKNCIIVKQKDKMHLIGVKKTWVEYKYLYYAKGIGLVKMVDHSGNVSVLDSLGKASLSPMSY